MNMLRHYIKLAIRNLIKYKSQSVISIIGLAIGFTCFALSTLWIRYEQTYDTFHDGADRIYFVRPESYMYSSGLSEISPYPLAGFLKATFPEVEDACNMQAWYTSFKYKGKEYKSFKIGVDSATVQMFNIQIVSGSKDFMIRDNNQVAITEQLASRLFGKEDPIGKTLDIYGEKSICAVVKAWDTHSNLPFELLESNGADKEWNVSSWQTYIKLRKGTDIKAFRKKLLEYKTKPDQTFSIDKIVLTPITSMRYDRPSRQETVKYEHIFLFASAGGLVILCALFNYLTLFITRIRMRSREIALRKVCGSSDRNQMVLFGVEYSITLLLALFIGLILIELTLPTFRELSDIKLDNPDIYLKAIEYATVVAVFSFLLSLYPIYYFRKKTLNAMLKGSTGGKNKNIFQKVSMITQFIISICFIFCAVILMKQIHYLNKADFGLERTNRAFISVYPVIDGLKEEITKIPFITEIFPDNISPIFPRYGRSYRTVGEWEGRQDSTASVNFEMFDCNQAYFNFYGLQLLEGAIPADGDDVHILINQAGIKSLNIDHPIGKTIKKGESNWVIAGVIKDFYIAPPTVPCSPIVMIFKKETDFSSNGSILFKYQEGSWNNCKERLETLVKKLNPNVRSCQICNMEEEYEKFLKSENALLMMLDFVTLVCVLISLFGVFSLVTLDCEKRRKEIAIRKVNGAETSHIMKAFLLKYMFLLLIASAIAFPIGYLIMKPWIESYVLQTNIDFWIYPAIWLSLALLIITCTGWRIWNAANQNPAEVVKSE